MKAVDLAEQRGSQQVAMTVVHWVVRTAVYSVAGKADCLVEQWVGG